MSNMTGIAYIEFQNVSMTTALSFLYLIQLALSCTLETPVALRWAIEKTGTNHTIYDITLRSTNITECINTTWPINHPSPNSPYSVGVNYGIPNMTPKILEHGILSFNTWVAKANQTRSVAGAMGSPYFFSAAPYQLLRLYTANYTQQTSFAEYTSFIASIPLLFISTLLTVHNIV